MTPNIDGIGLVTSDVGRTVDFYRALGCLPTVAGVEGSAGADGEGGHLDIDLGQVRLMIDTEEVMASFDPRWNQPAGRVSLAVRCAHPDAVDDLHEQLSRLGAGSHLEPFDAPWGQRYASVLDPDGIRIDLYASLG